MRASVKDPLQEFILRTVGGKDALFALLQRCTHDSDAVRIVEAWSGLVRPSRARGIDISAVLDRADMDPRTFVSVVVRCAWDLNLDIGRAIFAMRYPKLMEASMEKAIHGDSVEREKMHFVAAGHVPGPRGIQIGIVNNAHQDVPDEPKPGRLPSFRQTAREVVRDLPPVKALPTSTE